MTRRPAALRRAVIVQLETDPAVSVRLTPAALAGYARALARCWSLAGVSRGDTVAIFDYGTSPVTYLASFAYLPYLGRGAADLLGCISVCSDGVPEMAPRVVRILRYLRPRVLFARPEGLVPLARQAEAEGLALARCVDRLVVTQDEGLLRPRAREEWQRRLGVPISSLLRVDARLFLAMECPECRLHHTWGDLYRVDLVDAPAEGARPADGAGYLRARPTFARGVGRGYVSSLRATTLAGGCQRGPGDQRLAF